MKRLLLLALLLSPAIACATDLTLACTAPTTFTDGTPIPAGTAITFNFYGAMQGSPLALVSGAPFATCSSVRTNVNIGTLCYAATAVVNGQESAQSPQVCYTNVAPGPAPAAPGGLTVTPVTVATTAYMELQVPNGFSFLAIGTVPLGTPCNPAQRVNNFNVVDAAAVTWTGSIKRLAVLAACSIS